MPAKVIMPSLLVTSPDNERPISCQHFSQVSQFFPEHFWAGVVGSAVFGVVGIVLLLLGYWLFDKITPRIDVQKELAEKDSR